jgi:hypothetical protein
MDRLAWYNEDSASPAMEQAAQGLQVVVVSSLRELAEAIIEQPSLMGVVVETARLDDEWQSFLTSVRQSFAVLPILLVVPDKPASCPPGVRCVTPASASDEIARALRDLADEEGARERRHHHRYQWPLAATIVGGDGTRHRISEVSAGGAFLEPVAPTVQSGETYELDIYFQNFKMRVTGYVRTARAAGSDGDDGFGLEFVDLSADAVAFLDRVVHDALVQTLLEPESEPDIPVISMEEDLLTIGDEFSRL